MTMKNYLVRIACVACPMHEVVATIGSTEQECNYHLFNHRHR